MEETSKPVVFITGASRGIGLATARKFASNGWGVAGFYKNSPGPEIDNVRWYQVDLTIKNDVFESFEKAFSDFGKMDALVNNAGVFGYKNLSDYDEKLMDEVIGLNEKGVYFCTQWAISKMTHGSITNLSSTAGQVGSSDPIYAASKGAIAAFTKSMAKALAPNIRVNAVSPGATFTDMMKGHDPERIKKLEEMTLTKRLGNPEEIANGIFFLASEEASYITGACLDVNGGYVLR